MADTDHSKLDAWLDLLAEQVAEKLETRWKARETRPEPPKPVQPPVAAAPGKAAQASVPELKRDSPQNPPARKPVEDAGPAPLAATSSHAAALMARLAVGVLLVVVLINIPLNTQGIALARSIPSSASLVIANGLLVKEENSPDIWVYQDEQFHWITSLEAFDHYRYLWRNVHIVEPGFLNQFEKGSPIYVLLKCPDSPHVYRLEAGQKRWIVDIPTFEAEGYIWQDVKFVSCNYLRLFPDGDSIPPGRGTPPPPLP